MGLGVDVRVELASDKKHDVFGQGFGQRRREVDHRFLDFRSRQGGHGFTDAHHLAGLDRPIGDHRIMVCTQVAVAELVFGLI
jgi:hypothetical protein